MYLNLDHVTIILVHVIGINYAKIKPLASLEVTHLEVFVLLQQVSHGAIQFTAYEELREVIVDLKSKGSKKDSESDDKLLVSLYNQCPLYILVHRNCINVHRL